MTVVVRAACKYCLWVALTNNCYVFDAGSSKCLSAQFRNENMYESKLEIKKDSKIFNAMNIFQPYLIYTISRYSRSKTLRNYNGLAVLNV